MVSGNFLRNGIETMKAKRQHILSYTCNILFIVCQMLIFSSIAQAQSTCGGSSCSNSTCQLTLNSQGHLSNNCPSGTRYDVDPNCVMNQNAEPGSCIDTMPVASINRVSETNCFRANGAGGNPKPRNHLGTDYASTQGTAVTAAADGTVVWAKPMGGGGRTIIIEHEKACQCTAGNPGGSCDSKYITVYMHLQNFAVTGGSVKKGAVIGWVGGSNYSSSSGILCDYPDTNSTDNCKPYGPHLHFEIHSGPFSKGYSNLKSSIINPLCDDIQQFCGGCSYDVDKCQNKDGAQSWETLSEEASATKKQASATGQTTAPLQDTPSLMMSECALSRFLADGDTCWFCSIFRVLFNTASTIALKAYKALADSIAIVVVVGYAIWVSIVILKHIAAVEVKDPRKLLQELMIQAFKVLLVVIILKMSFFQVMHLTLEPVFNTGMTFVQTISEGNCSSGASYMQNINGYDSDTGVTDSSTGGLPKSIGESIICSIKSMQDSIMRMIAYGRQAWCVAWGPESFLWGILPHFAYLITSLVIMIGGFVLLVSFPWCLVDCVIQMSIAAGLAPAAIGAWAFKATGRYLKMIWDFFMNAMFNFVFLSIIIYIIMTVVDQFMGGLTNRNANDWGFLIDPIDGLAYWGVSGLKLVVICLMGWVFLDEGKSFADKFAKGAIDGIGRSVGGTFAQAGSKVGGAALKAGKATFGAALQVGDHFIGSRIRDKVNNYRINKVKNGADNVIRDENGNITGYERTRRNVFGKKVTRRVDIGEDGKETWSKEKHSLSAEIGNKISNKINNVRRDLMFNRDKDENGNLVGAKDILDDKGNIIARETEHGKEYYDAEGKVIAREHYHRNLLGRKVTTRDQLGEDGKWHMTRQKSNARMELLAVATAKLQPFLDKQVVKHSNPDSKLARAAHSALSKLQASNEAVHRFADRNIEGKEKVLGAENQTSKIVSADKYLKVISHKGSNGEIVGKEFAFHANSAKHFVNPDGSINMQTISAIATYSNIDTKTIMEGATLSILESRGVQISNKFESRKVQYDKNTGALSIEQKNLDGSTSIISMSIGGPNGNQMLTEVKTIDSEGRTTIQKDNGIQNCTITEDNKGRQIARYGFSQEYLRRHKYEKVLNSNGQFARNLDVPAAMYGFTEKDHQLHTAQVKTGRAQLYSLPQTNTPDGRTPTPDSRTPTPDGRTPTPDGGTPTPDGRTPTPDDRTPTPDGGTPTPDDRTPTPDGGIPTPDGRTPTPDGGIPTPDGRTPTPDDRMPNPDDERSPNPDEERDQNADEQNPDDDKPKDDERNDEPKEEGEEEKSAQDELLDIITDSDEVLTPEEQERVDRELTEESLDNRQQLWNLKAESSRINDELEQLKTYKQANESRLSAEELNDITVRIRQLTDELRAVTDALRRLN